MTERKKRKTIPAFKSREEEAAFWDTHDFTEYPEGFKRVRVRFAKRLSDGITIRFDPDTLERLRAEKKGVGPTTLARMWIVERLEEER